MTDALYSIDVAIFYFFNHTLANPVFDKFFVFITEADNWFIAYLILLGISFFKGGRAGKIAAVGSLILITASDQFSSFAVKNWIARIRPCNVLPDVRDLTGCSGSFSFPSSHAVNNFAAFIFFSRFYPKIKWILFITALLISISRVYIGRHYPSDILGGALIGSAMGYIFASAALWLHSFISEKYKKTVV